jgi:hypothetical protein
MWDGLRFSTRWGGLLKDPSRSRFDLSAIKEINFKNMDCEPFNH